MAFGCPIGLLLSPSEDDIDSQFPIFLREFCDLHLFLPGVLPEVLQQRLASPTIHINPKLLFLCLPMSHFDNKAISDNLTFGAEEQRVHSASAARGRGQ